MPPTIGIPRSPPGPSLCASVIRPNGYAPPPVGRAWPNRSDATARRPATPSASVTMSLHKLTAGYDQLTRHQKGGATATDHQRLRARQDPRQTLAAQPPGWPPCRALAEGSAP
jgi:hypothetical protein